MRTVGQNVARIRERLGLSQIDLADRLKMRQPSVWKLENSKGLPKGPTLLKLAKTLPCFVEELFEGVDGEYDAIVRDLPRHGGTGQQTPHRKGESDDPASDRERQLEGRIKAYETIVRHVHEVARELVAATGSESREASRDQSRRRRRDRKAS